MDSLHLTGIACDVHIGVPEEERRSPQRILLDVRLEADLKEAGETDDLTRSLDYQRLEALLRSEAQASRFKLIESLAEALAAKILASCPQARTATVAVRKKPAAMPDTAEVAVEITRQRR